MKAGTPDPRGFPHDTRYLYEPRDLEVKPHWSWLAHNARKLGAQKAAKTRAAKRNDEGLRLLFG